ncbi:hypothetical protein DTO063F5_7753 [Paecilomyces variotii]|nr:hypothetical protein DTO063F5_7753 [Paecilomyces variotii]
MGESLLGLSTYLYSILRIEKYRLEDRTWRHSDNLQVIREINHHWRIEAIDKQTSCFRCWSIKPIRHSLAPTSLIRPFMITPRQLRSFTDRSRSPGQNTQ